MEILVHGCVFGLSSGKFIRMHTLRRQIGVNENEVMTEVKESAHISLMNAAQTAIVDNIVSKISSYNKLLRFFAIRIRLKKII